MQYVHQNFIIKALQDSLQNATYEPVLVGCHYNAPFYPRLAPSKHVTSGKLKHALKAFGLLALSLPVGASLPFSSPDGLEHIQLTNQLHIANTAHDDFALDIATRYAQSLEATVNLHHYNSEQAALTALATGQVDILLSDNNQLSDATKEQSASCHNNPNGGVFVFRASDDRLADHAKDYLCRSDTLIANANIAKFYDPNLLNDYSHNFFIETLERKLPRYEFAFKTYAEDYDHDWQLLVAVAYQESQLNPHAISPTGVQGLMMLTRDTAAAMGIDDRTDPVQSIEGGAKYLSQLQDFFEDIPENDRLWFVLAGYNMGPNAVRNVQEKIRSQGNDPAIWGNFYDYLAKNTQSNSRYLQCMHYVTGVRHYLKLLQQKTIQ